MANLDERADQFIEKEMADNEQIKQFILSNKGKNTELDIYGLKIQVPAVIPKKLRHELAKIQRKGDVDIEEAEQDTYYLLSLLCQNEPYNLKEMWERLDDETGLSIEILREVLERAYQSEEKSKKFRGK